MASRRRTLLVHCLLMNVSIEIAGYSVASLLLNDLVDVSGMEPRIRRVVADALFVGGHALLTQLVDSRNLRSLMDKEFMSSTLFRIVGFATYDVLLA